MNRNNHTHPAPAAWLVRRLAGLALAVLVSGGSALAQTPTAGTRIGNQAVATYTDGNGVDRVVTSNLVETVITQIAGVTIESDNTIRATENSQVVFPHEITNTGNGTDTFDILVVQSGGDDFDLGGPLAAYADADANGIPDDLSTPITATQPLAPGETFTFVLVGTIPAGQTVGHQASLTVDARSQFDAGVDTSPGDTDTDLVTVTNEAVIEIQKSMSLRQSTAPSPNVTVRIDYTNTGALTALDVTLTDALPAGLTYVAGSGRWSVTGATVLTDANDGTQGGGPTIDYQEAAGTVTAVINNVPVSTTGFITFEFTATAGTPAGIYPNTAQVSYDPDGVAGGPTVGPENSNTVPFEVLPTAGVTIQADNDITFATDPDAPGAPFDNIVASAPQGGTVTFINHVRNDGNKQDTFDITLDNTSATVSGGSRFPAGSIFTLYKEDGISLLLDTNNNGIPDTGPLNAGSFYRVVLKVQLPPGVSGGGSYEVDKIATSSNDTGVSAQDEDRLGTIVAAQVDLTNDTSVDGGAVGGGILSAGDGQGAGAEAANDWVRTQTGAPGATVTFNLVVNMLSDPADNFDLSAWNDAAASTSPLTSWTVVFKDGAAQVGNTGSLSQGATNAVDGGPDEKVIVAEVTVPASGLAGGHQQSIYFKAQSPVGGASDIIHDQVVVGNVRNVRLSPDNLQQQTSSPGTAVYAHILENLGNVTEGTGTGVTSQCDLTISDDTAGFGSSLYYDANDNGIYEGGTDTLITAGDITASGVGVLADGLAAGERRRIFVVVNVAAGVSAGTTNRSQVDFSCDDGTYGGGTAPTAQQVVDQTTVVAGDLELTKRQALDTGCDGNDTPGVFQVATINAAPGDCVRYFLRIENTGGVDATATVLSDSTPAFTTQSNGGSAVLGVDVGPPSFRLNAGAFGAVTSSPGDGAAGQVSHTIGTMSPGDVGELYYGVRVNP